MPETATKISTLCNNIYICISKSIPVQSGWNNSFMQDSVNVLELLQLAAQATCYSNYFYSPLKLEFKLISDILL